MEPNQSPPRGAPRNGKKSTREGVELELESLVILLMMAYFSVIFWAFFLTELMLEVRAIRACARRDRYRVPLARSGGQERPQAVEFLPWDALGPPGRGVPGGQPPRHGGHFVFGLIWIYRTAGSVIENHD